MEKKKSGRPPLYNKKMTIINVWVTDAQREWLRKKTASEFIRGLIEQAMKEEENGSK